MQASRDPCCLARHARSLPSATGPTPGSSACRPESGHPRRSRRAPRLPDARENLAEILRLDSRRERDQTVRGCP
jgi:hypothetical protein